MTLKIHQPDQITKKNQGFNKNLKLLMNFKTPDTPHEGIVQNKKNRHKNIIRSTEEIQEWYKIATIPCKSLTTRII